MNWQRIKTVLLVIALAGCVRHQSAPGLQPDDPPALQPVCLSSRITDLDHRLDALTILAKQLPGKNDREHRNLLVAVLTELTGTLPDLTTANPPAAFRQQLQILGDTRTQLQTGLAALAVEPTIDSGLRAAYNALRLLGQRDFNQQRGITLSLDRLAVTLDQLDATRGSRHRSVVTDAIWAMTTVMQHMADTLQQQIGTGKAGSWLGRTYANLTN